RVDRGCAEGMERRLTQQEQDDLIARYANGHITWSELRRYDEFESYLDVLAGLGRLGLRPPIAPMTGPNAVSRKRRIEMVRAALRNQERKAMWPATLAEVAIARNQGKIFSDLLAGFLNTFYSALRDNGDAYACIAEEPEPVTDPREHALLGAIAEHLAMR